MQVLDVLHYQYSEISLDTKGIVIIECSDFCEVPINYVSNELLFNLINCNDKIVIISILKVI